MNREYHKWLSPALGREMEVLVFGHAGPPAIAFSTSCGRFFDFEDRGMVNAVRHKLEAGHLQLFCIDSVDAESWYNRTVVPRARVARHLRFEHYILEEIVPFVHHRNGSSSSSLSAIGCSFGGYHAVNIALRYPEIFTGILSMGGALDPSGFLSGYYDQDCYLNLPTHYMPNMSDAHYFDSYRRNTCVLATGINDVCRDMNQQMAHILHTKEIPCRLDVWGDDAGHDWHTWQRMIQAYL
ncbi:MULTISPECIES: esterase family protein [Acidobacteriaceae]|uniref:esterase family protein n=1 Tax=Acidobacteriaceae TaxID=204434 RepID=UPI00131D01C5|nr:MULTISPECIES: alpha/beta hydrolase-fold protein [Acidobacteriaceae]MDW5264413.1 alpha/beta hydrolase-fold protein [Edaphobacter sp.]